MELSAVVAVLSILGALSLPSILSFVKLARIDEAKSLLNTAAAECLQIIRSGGNPTETAPSTTTISNERLESIGYKLKSDSNKCSSFFIEPTDADETILYTLGFRISADGKILKVAIPARDQASLSSCKAWAGPNCGITPELQAEWDRIAAIEKAKKECNDGFYEWLRNTQPNGGSGSNSRWDDSSNTCTLTTWAFEGTIQRDETAFKAAREAKLGKICSQKLKDSESSGFDGQFTDSECGISTWFCSGKDLNSQNKTDYDACKEEQRQKRCMAAEGAWKGSGENGMFSEPGCNAKWKCGSTVYTSESDYNSSSCGQICTSEQVQIGMTSQTVQVGSEPIVERQCRRVGFFNVCNEVQTGSRPIYGVRQVPAYETRQVCRSR